MKTFSKVPGNNEQSRHIPCPVCEGSRFSDKWALGSSLFVKCRRCGLILQNPQPVRESLAARYDEEYFNYEIENQESFFNLMLLGLKDINFFEEVVPGLPQPPSALDIGCATGRLLKYFKDDGWQTAGAELCIESAEYGNSEYGVNIMPCSLEDADFPSESFSAVHASHLIEHVDNPASFADEVFRVLKPGGVFVCVTPASDGLQARLFGSSWRSIIEDHVTLFSRRTLAKLLQNAGFRVEGFRTWGGLAVGSAPRWLKNPVDQLAKKWNFGDVVLMLARKPF